MLIYSIFIPYRTYMEYLARSAGLFAVLSSPFLGTNGDQYIGRSPLQRLAVFETTQSASLTSRLTDLPFVGFNFRSLSVFTKSK